MKANLPKSWLQLPPNEKRIIEKLVEEEVRKTVDHEEAILQKRWLQLACIVLHRQKDPYGKMRCMTFLNGFKRVYRKCKNFTSNEDIDAFLKKEMEPIFGVDGYPAEWVDSLENGV